MTTITLPKIPVGESLEDYVAAFLQCGGYYTEKSLIETGETQVMELDIMAWKPANRPPQHELFEVKGGNWGFPEVFKVYGWKTYLLPRGVQSAYLVAPKGGRTTKVLDYIRDKCAEIGISLITHSDLTSLETEIKFLGLAPATTNELDHAMWRFSFWLERQMQQVVISSRRSMPGYKGPNELYQYQELIRNGFLQARDVRDRLASLYAAHFEHQQLAKTVAAELDGKGWIAENPPSGSHWTAALYNCQHLLVQAAMYLEHRSRLSILKAAVEYALLEGHGVLPPTRTIKFLGLELIADYLPSSFHNAVRELKAIDGYEKIPVLWQSFLWKWGGFFLTDQESAEKTALAEEVGMTVTAVDQALALYGTLFPLPDGWMYESQGTRFMKLFPCAFRGLGVNYRRRRLGAASIDEAFGSSPHLHLRTNIGRWNNSTVSLLQYGTRHAEPATTT